MVKRYRGPLVAFAAAIVSASGAEDVVQSALAKAHGALLADDREINLRPWLFTIVRNTALNEVRREPRVDELSEAMATSAGPSEIAEQNDEFDRLILAMCALPDAQRQALVMRELEGVGHGEIAAQLGTTATAVRGLIFRARSGLRDAVGALIPMPILRTLLSDATATGIAGGAAGGAGAGAAAIIGGGGAAKGATMIAAAVVALGTGLAIDQGRQRPLLGRRKGLRRSGNARHPVGHRRSGAEPRRYRAARPRPRPPRPLRTTASRCRPARSSQEGVAARTSRAHRANPAHPAARRLR